MSLLKTRHYNLQLKPLLISTCALALVFAAFRVLIDDTLTLGYAMGVAVFLYISVATENARIGRSGFADLRPWLETLTAVAVGAAVAYLGYKAWLIGY